MKGAMGERLMSVIHHYNLNMNQFSVRLGLKSNSVVTRAIRENTRGISLELMQKILTTFPDVDARWLALGEGNMLYSMHVVRNEKDESLCSHCLEKDKEIVKKEILISQLSHYILELEAKLEPQKNIKNEPDIQRRKVG